MSTKNEYTGKDVAGAIKQACSNLNVSREHLNIQVISAGSTGILGLFRKNAVIQASLKNAPPENTSQGKASRKPKRIKNAGKGKKPVTKKTAPQKTAVKKESQKASPEVLTEIKSATEAVLKHMGYPAQATLSENNGKVMVNIAGDHIEAIIGQEGNTLDALQYLVRKIVSQKFSEKIMLSMDAGDYRANRRKELEELALEISRIVKKGGKSRIIAPLNPAERRIIHVTLQDDKTIRSKSIGEGLFKKIKVYIPGQGRKRSRKRRNYSKPRQQQKKQQ